MGPVLIFILLALLWVVLIVPRQREVRRHNALVASLQVGDEVMTGAGIYGTIVSMGDDDVSVEIAPGVSVRMAKRAVGSRIEPAETGASGPSDGSSQIHDDTFDDQIHVIDDEDHDHGRALEDSADEPSPRSHSQIDRTED
jgi:preprotein translocase subunit YajC